MKKKKLKQTNASVHLVQYRFKIREGSPEGIRMTMEEKDLWKRWVLSLEWKTDGVIDGELRYVKKSSYRRQTQAISVARFI